MASIKEKATPLGTDPPSSFMSRLAALLGGPPVIKECLRAYRDVSYLSTSSLVVVVTVDAECLLVSLSPMDLLDFCVGISQQFCLGRRSLVSMVTVATERLLRGLRVVFSFCGADGVSLVSMEQQLWSF